MTEPVDPNPPAAFAPPSLDPRPLPPAGYGPAGYGPADYASPIYGPAYGPTPGYPVYGPTSSYPTLGYAPQAYAPQSYAPQGYGYPPAYAMAGFPPRDSRPGLVAASAVLAFVEAGLLVASGLLLLLGASFVNAMSTDLTSEDHNTVVWLAIGGVVNIVVATAAVVGGISLLTRRSIGRWWLSAAAALDLISALVWLVNHPGSFVLAVLLAAPLILAAAFAWPQPVTNWLSAPATALIN